MIGELAFFNQMLKYGDVQINTPVYSVGCNSRGYIVEQAGVVSKIVITADGYSFFTEDDINILENKNLFLKKEEAEKITNDLNKFMKFNVSATAWCEENMSNNNKYRRNKCPMRHSENGNCLPMGGFCSSVNDCICEALHNAYNHGQYDMRVDIAEVMRKKNEF